MTTLILEIPQIALPISITIFVVMGFAVIAYFFFKSRAGKDIPNQRPESSGLPKYENPPQVPAKQVAEAQEAFSDMSTAITTLSEDDIRKMSGFAGMGIEIQKVSRNTKGQFTEPNPYNIKQDKVTGKFLKLK